MLDSAGSFALAFIFGLLIGSFLNVVIHRLPKMLEQQWAAEYAHYAAESAEVPDATASRKGQVRQRSIR